MYLNAVKLDKRKKNLLKNSTKSMYYTDHYFIYVYFHSVCQALRNLRCGSQKFPIHHLIHKQTGFYGISYAFFVQWYPKHGHLIPPLYTCVS